MRMPTVTKKEKKPKADDSCSTNGSQHRGVNRRQFATNTGVLLGILAAGEPALGQAPVADAGGTSTGPWDNPALAKFREWDPVWIEQCLKMSGDPWTSGVLPRKDVELISLAVNAACTTLSPEGTRRHVRGALEAGASRDEILMILKIGSLLSIHTCSLGAPILLEEAKAIGVKRTPQAAATPVCDKMKAAGQWNSAWDAFFEIDPAWTEAIIAASLPAYTSGVLSPKLAEFLSIAVDASINHMYAPGTRRHIQTALKLGATTEEIMEVLKICVSQGIQSCNLGVPILAEELAKRPR